MTDYPVEDAIDSRNVFEVLKARRTAYEKVKAHLGSKEFDPLLTCNEWAIAAIRTASPDAAQALDGAEDEVVWMAYETWEKTRSSRTDSILNPMRIDVVYVGSGKTYRTDSMKEYRVDQDAIDCLGIHTAYLNGYNVPIEYENERKREIMQRDVIRADHAARLSSTDPFARTGAAAQSVATKQDSSNKKRFETAGMTPLQIARKERELELAERNPFAR